MEKFMEEDTFYSVREFAALLKVNKFYVYKMLSEGKLKAVNLNQGMQHALYRIPRSEVLRLISQSYEQKNV